MMIWRDEPTIRPAQFPALPTWWHTVRGHWAATTRRTSTVHEVVCSCGKRWTLTVDRRPRTPAATPEADTAARLYDVQTGGLGGWS